MRHALACEQRVGALHDRICPAPIGQPLEHHREFLVLRKHAEGLVQLGLRQREVVRLERKVDIGLPGGGNGRQDFQRAGVLRVAVEHPPVSGHNGSEGLVRITTQCLGPLPCRRRRDILRQPRARQEIRDRGPLGDTEIPRQPDAEHDHRRESGGSGPTARRALSLHPNRPRRERRPRHGANLHGGYRINPRRGNRRRTRHRDGIERKNHVHAGPKPRVRVLRKPPVHHVLIRGHRRRQTGGRDSRSEVAVAGRAGDLAGQHEAEDDAEAVQVRPAVHGSSRRLFRTHVAGGAGNRRSGRRCPRL